VQTRTGGLAPTFGLGDKTVAAKGTIAGSRGAVGVPTVVSAPGLPAGLAALLPTVGAANATTAAGSTTPTAAGLAADVARQLAAPVFGLPRHAGSVHSITIQLHPDDLGPVRLTIEMRHGSIDVQLAGSGDVARDVLRQALPELRRQLSEGGMTAGNLGVSERDASAGSQQRSLPQPAADDWSGPSLPTDKSAAQTPPGVRARAAVQSSALDLVV
jgi:hypothetical protein